MSKLKTWISFKTSFWTGFEDGIKSLGSNELVLNCETVFIVCKSAIYLHRLFEGLIIP